MPRVTITFEEAATVGLKPGSHLNTWGERLMPLAIAKGVPAARLYVGSMAVRCINHESGMDIEWDEAGVVSLPNGERVQL